MPESKHVAAPPYNLPPQAQQAASYVAPEGRAQGYFAPRSTPGLGGYGMFRDPARVVPLSELIGSSPSGGGGGGNSATQAPNLGPDQGTPWTSPVDYTNVDTGVGGIGNIPLPNVDWSDPAAVNAYLQSIGLADTPGGGDAAPEPTDEPVIDPAAPYAGPAIDWTDPTAVNAWLDGLNGAGGATGGGNTPPVLIDPNPTYDPTIPTGHPGGPAGPAQTPPATTPPATTPPLTIPPFDLNIPGNGGINPGGMYTPPVTPQPPVQPPAPPQPPVQPPAPPQPPVQPPAPPQPPVQPPAPPQPPATTPTFNPGTIDLSAIGGGMFTPPPLTGVPPAVAPAPTPPPQPQPQPTLPPGFTLPPMFGAGGGSPSGMFSPTAGFSIGL